MKLGFTADLSTGIVISTRGFCLAILGLYLDIAWEGWRVLKFGPFRTNLGTGIGCSVRGCYIAILGICFQITWKIWVVK